VGVAGGSGGAQLGEVPVIPVPAPEGGAEMGDAGACRHIVAIIRDFTPAHPDFERALALFPPVRPAVKPELVQGYPAYALPGPDFHYAGAEAFAEWYVDTPGVNQRFSVELPLTEETPGHFVYDSSAFFPIDGKGFGNQNNAHNFHFTTEVRTLFTYRTGQAFTFRGDDDLWVFVNDHLVMDLGGLHSAEQATVSMDSVASTIGLELGKTYPMALFHAERHTDQSNFRIETSISCFVNVPPPPPPRIE
jgi:fibro-slime domain-containing protein